MEQAGVSANDVKGSAQDLARLRDQIYERITELRNGSEPIARAYVALESGIRGLMQGKVVSPEKLQRITYLQVLKTAVK